MSGIVLCPAPVRKFALTQDALWPPQGLSIERSSSCVRSQRTSQKHQAQLGVTSVRSRSRSRLRSAVSIREAAFKGSTEDTWHHDAYVECIRKVMSSSNRHGKTRKHGRMCLLCARASVHQPLVKRIEGVCGMWGRRETVPFARTWHGDQLALGMSSQRFATWIPTPSSSSSSFMLRWSKSRSSSVCVPHGAARNEVEAESDITVRREAEGIKEELNQLVNLLPVAIKEKLVAHPSLDNLLEIVMDLGRRPMARFPSPEGDVILTESNVTAEDIAYAVAQVGEFGGDNRAGIDRTLHRISAIRNRAGKIVGLTCRVGRAIHGSAEMVRDLVAGGGSLLLMGPPGVGKTTAIREVARMLAEDYDRRVVIVDTSNEIGGDGDIPHPGIGNARRMQVARVELQHEVMIEAVENHMPETIVIDEIGTELEANAAGTIAQRGVQLVGTAHGMTIENLIKNPSLSNLAGGVNTVTLGDDEARRRGVQKTVLERRGPPTFTSAVEMISRTEWRIHRSLSVTVDALLAGKRPRVEVRKLEEDGEVDAAQREKDGRFTTGAVGSNSGYISDDDTGEEDDDSDDDDEEEEEEESGSFQNNGPKATDGSVPSLSRERKGWFAGERSADIPLMLYTYQIAESSLEQVMEVMGLSDMVQLTDDIGIADAVLALRSRLKQKSWVRGIARDRQLPIFAIKANSMAQLVRAMRAILGMEMLGSVPAASTPSLSSSSFHRANVNHASGAPWQAIPQSTLEDEIDALEEAKLAVEQIVIAKGQPAELLPRATNILILQGKLVENYQLKSELCGIDPNCRLRILPEYMDQHAKDGPLKKEIVLIGDINSNGSTSSRNSSGGPKSRHGTRAKGSGSDTSDDKRGLPLASDSLTE